jgi:hypothetical protein
VGAPHGTDVIVPGEVGMPILPADRKTGEHFPGVYHETLQRIGAFEPGAIVLIAAGVCGKVYAHRAKTAGCIGLDVGAIADYFMGIQTRAVFRDAAFGAGFAPALVSEAPTERR